MGTRAESEVIVGQQDESLELVANDLRPEGVLRGGRGEGPEREERRRGGERLEREERE